MCRFGEREGDRSVTEEVHKPIRVGETVGGGGAVGGGASKRQKGDHRRSKMMTTRVLCHMEFRKFKKKAEKRQGG